MEEDKVLWSLTAWSCLCPYSIYLHMHFQFCCHRDSNSQNRLSYRWLILSSRVNLRVEDPPVFSGASLPATALNEWQDAIHA